MSDFSTYAFPGNYDATTLDDFEYDANNPAAVEGTYYGYFQDFAYSSYFWPIVQGMYQQFLNRGETQAELSAAAYIFANDYPANPAVGYLVGQFGNVAYSIIHSAEETNDINNLSQAMTGSAATSAEISGYQSGLYSGQYGNLKAVQAAIANSAACATAINGVYQTCLGRAADPGGLATYQSAFAAGTLANLTAFRSIAAYSPEAQSDLNGIWQSDLGRPIDPGGLASFQQDLATNTSLAQVKLAVAYGAEAQTDITNASLAIAGVAPDAPTLASYETILASTTGNGIQAVAEAIAASPGVQAELASDAAAVLGNPLTASQTQAQTAFVVADLANTAGLNWQNAPGAVVSDAAQYSITAPPLNVSTQTAESLPDPADKYGSKFAVNTSSDQSPAADGAVSNMQAAIRAMIFLSETKNANSGVSMPDGSLVTYGQLTDSLERLEFDVVDTAFGPNRAGANVIGSDGLIHVQINVTQFEQYASRVGGIDYLIGHEIAHDTPGGLASSASSWKAFQADPQYSSVPSSQRYNTYAASSPEFIKNEQWANSGGLAITRGLGVANLTVVPTFGFYGD